MALPSGKFCAYLLVLTMFVVTLFARKHLFGQVTGRASGWPVLKKAVVKQNSKIISKALPSPRVDLSINLVVVPYPKYNASDEAIIERKREYLTALQRNLNHEFVSHVHVLTTNALQHDEMLQHFNLLTNQSKLIVSELKSIDTMRDSFDYISKNLVDKDVVFANADIYLGGGFNRVDATVLSNRNIMYALTRRIAQEEKEKCGETDLCVEHDYVGSHDTFLFHLTEPLPEKALKHLEIKLPSPGMENVLMWVFQHQLNYCTLNPCTILETFHLHCSKLRNKMGKRVNHANYSGLAPFTKKLVC